MPSNYKIGSRSCLKQIIPTGRENAISTAVLMEKAGYSDIRKVRQDIRILRIDGEVILSTTQKGGGYYRPKDKAELQRFIRQEEHRAKSVFYALKAARRLLKSGNIDTAGKEKQV